VTSPTEGQVVWAPSRQEADRTNVMRLAHTHGIGNYRQLLSRSQIDPEWFWDAVVRDLHIEFSRPYERVLDSSRGPEWPAWFLGGRLNLAWNCVGRWALATPDAAAVLWEGESGACRRLTYAQLWQQTCRFATGLRTVGVEPGDRVALYLPMIPEVVVASHACALIGAIQVPIFSGFAAPAVAARLSDAKARVVVTASASKRRGSPYPMKPIVDEVLTQAPSVERVIVLEPPDLGAGVPLKETRDLTWGEFVAGCSEDVCVEAFDSEHPYLLAYTSGTTGRPKGAVHATAGFLVKVVEEVAYQADMTSKDILYWVTDIGWLMGPWEIVGAGALGGTVMLSEGAPNVPPDRLWTQCERQRVSILGVSPTLVRGLMSHGDQRVQAHDLSSLRILGSTGEPWNPAPYRWIFSVVGKGRLPIINMTGGTEVGACFLSATPAMPIKECSVGMPSLGMVMDVLDPEGRSLPLGQVGELVCREPWPAMTRGLWRDPERYLDSYWRRFPGVWTHGDWASVDDDGYWFLYGRSDDTLNVAGKRIGPTELESLLVAHPLVSEAAAVAMPHKVKGEVPWCFCVLLPGVEANENLAIELSEEVATRLSKSFKPERVVFVPTLPKTRSAKIVRRAVRALALEEDPGDLSSLENPDALPAIKAALGEQAYQG
jgi:acetyl-CoA synthetase